MAPAARTPGELALHPVALTSLALLVLNDHVLKGVGPAWLTGKLSDVAGLAFLPFLALALGDAIRRGRRAPGLRAAAATAAATGVVFAAVKLVEPVRAGAAAAAGVARAPLDALLAVVSGASPPPVAPATIVGDPTDVIAVVACAAVVLVVRGRAATDVPPGHTAAPTVG